MMDAGLDLSSLERPEVLTHLFPPGREQMAAPPPCSRDVFVAVDPGIEVGVRLFPWEPQAPHVILFQGPGQTTGDCDALGPAYNRHGMNLLVADYRGYGLSGGTPTISHLLADARQVFAELDRWLATDGRSGPRIVMGRALGSAAALEVACCFRDKVEALILESPFAWTVPYLERLGVATEELGICEGMGFANPHKIRSTGMPTLIIHGANDDVIPSSEGETLLAYSSSRRKQFLLASGCGHLDIVQRYGDIYFQTLSRFAAVTIMLRRKQANEGGFNRMRPRRQ
jgi:alpha-beta hydrolase superfamily lysophospholipase